MKNEWLTNSEDDKNPENQYISDVPSIIHLLTSSPVGETNDDK